MTELLTAAQMRVIEQEAITSGRVTGLELMERAGQGVVDAVLAEWPDLAEGARRAVVLCGPGNNGGDGFVVARLLKGLGWEVTVYLYGAPTKLPPDARVNFNAWQDIGPILSIADFPDRPGTPDTGEDGAHIVIDALFGTGLTRPIRGLGLVLLEVCEARAISSQCTNPRHRVGDLARVVSVDVPSGLCSDSGRILRAEDFKGTDDGVSAAPCINADLTVTFHRAKLGHYLADGPGACGKLVVVDIGL
ncbi:MAG: NAD(P)H-hydrate epimerase [Pseudomonadota bacterium]